MEEEGREFITPEIEKRQHRRAKLVTQVRCEALDREDLLVTRDISAGGMFITSKTPYPADSEVGLSFRLRPGDASISCQGKIAYSIPSLGMGIMFLDLDEQARLSIQKFVDEVN